ncbi:MAG: 1-acyl-sn-glycerol-3-phosphate acyltransferase [Planctomycetaceae bacterium]|nr:1-acyl-sn-glycerol-3-phosphate acyltransferase [Planctomycetaceae bacterium]
MSSPLRRTWLWRSFQIAYQVFFSLWLGYRSRGVENLPADGGALLLINHRSFLDPMLAGLPLHRPVSFVARHTLFSVPFVGAILRRTHVIPINRDSAGTASLREIVRHIDHGFLVGMFPEGTRNNGPDPLNPLKPGITSIIRRVDAPIIPIGIAGANRVMPRGAIFIRPRPVRVVIGNAIPPEELESLRVRGREQELLNFVGQCMSDTVREAEAWLNKGD